MNTAFDHLIKSPEGRVAFCVEQTITNVTELLSKHLNESGMTQVQLASAMGVTPGRVSQLLDGNANLTLKSVAKALAAFGHVLKAASVAVEHMTVAWPNELEAESWQPIRLHASAQGRSTPPPVRFVFASLDLTKEAA